MGNPIDGSDIPDGEEYKWYTGGVDTYESITVNSTDVSNTYIALAGVAERGTLWVSINGEPVAGLLEYKNTDKDESTEDDGCAYFFFTGAAENDVLEVFYVATGVTGLTQVAASQGVKYASSAGSITASIDGQSQKVTKTQAADQTVDFSELDYNLNLVTALYGDAISGSPATGDTKWSNINSGFKTVGAIVGKRTVNGSVVKKVTLMSCEAKGYTRDMMTEGFHKNSFSMSCGKIIVTEWA